MVEYKVKLNLFESTKSNELTHAAYIIETLESVDELRNKFTDNSPDTLHINVRKRWDTTRNMLAEVGNVKMVSTTKTNMDTFLSSHLQYKTQVRNYDWTTFPAPSSLHSDDDSSDSIP